MRICFVGHAFHRKTQSSGFFLDMLRTLGDVTEFYSDPDGDPRNDDTILRSLMTSNFDRYIFWQTERIAERLLPFELGMSFLVPMYDQAIFLPDAYWLRFVRHRFISFSRVHHETLQRLGCTTAYFQYFPEPQADPAGRAADRRDAFFWLRTPQGPITVDTVLALCRALDISALHVHAAPDLPSSLALPAPGVEDGVELTVSRWLASRADFAAIAGRPLFFFAPRPREGIGMATVEAMARGQIVVGPDLPTANEYLAHGCSGLLYDPAERPSRLPSPGAPELSRLSRGAVRRVTEGRRTWLGDLARLRSIIADDGQRWSTTDSSASFANRIRTMAHERRRQAA